MHLLDTATGTSNTPFIDDRLVLVPGYGRLQGVMFRIGDSSFASAPTAAAITVKSVPSMLMVNRNAGSGTRILTDRLLGNTRPDGYAYQTRSHTAVAVAQSRVNWGIAIAPVAYAYSLGFLPLQPEPYARVVPHTRLGGPAVQRLIAVLHGSPARAALRLAGLVA